MNRFKPHIALLICNIVWAMDYPFYNIVLPHYVHPMAMVAGSLAATALFSLVPLLWQKAERVARADIRKLIGAALLIGVLLEATESETLGWLLIVGFCGGFTTFSTFSADAVRLLRAECYGPAALYIGLSAAVCIAFAGLGMWIGTTLKN